MSDRKSIKPGGDNAVQQAGNEAAAIYSSHPIARFKMGRFQFERGVLKLNAEDSAEFDEQLAAQPAMIRNRIKKSTQADADRIARSFLQSRKTQGIDTTANSVGSGTGEAGSHANPMHPGASKDKETDGSAEPEFGPENDKIDPFDGDMERRVERNTPVQMADQVAGINSAGDLGATGASVAEEESAPAGAVQDEKAAESQERSQEAAETPAKPLFGLGKKANDADKQPD